MKPYYDDGNGIVIYHGDAREVLPTVKGVSVMLSDPPYNVGFNYPDWNDRLPEPEYLQFVREVLTLCASSGATNIAWFWQGIRVANGEARAVLPEGWRIHHCCSWFKREFAGDLSKGGHPAYCWEPIIWATCEDSPQYAGPRGGHAGRDCLVGNSPRHDIESKGHPCPKEFSVVSKALAWLPGPVVVDPWMGSGTVLHAAKNAGRSAIGVDISEQACEIATRRLAQEVLQLA